MKRMLARIETAILMGVITGLLILGLSSTVFALDAYDYESITVSTAAIGFTKSKILPTTGPQGKVAICTLEANNIRVRYDGSDPTSTTGHKIVTDVNTMVTIEGTVNLVNFKAIKDTASAGDGTLNCTILR